MNDGTLSVRITTEERLEIMGDHHITIIQGAETIAALRRYFAEEAHGRLVAETAKGRAVA